EFETPVFPSALEIYETFNPGAVVRIDVTDKFDPTDFEINPDTGNPNWYDPTGAEDFSNTPWTTIFKAREREIFLSETSRIFSPSMCPTDVPVTHVRVWFDVDGDGFNGVDAATLHGTVTMPLGHVPAYASN